jgi:N-acetyl-anhydromuramyl-L-alanine amidase AmpD|tara:strand:- start:117 stop:746 length:630 start_codon:yes stop_codon:yes gene_type:complete
MTIDNTTHTLNIGNFSKSRKKKRRIVITNSYNYGMNHVHGWRNRICGTYDKVTHFTVNKKGDTYQHLDPEYTAKVFNNRFDEETISITLENIGFLRLKIDDGNLVNWLNDIHTDEDIAFKKWRGYDFWDNYTKEQFNAVFELVRYLCNRFDIPTKVVGHGIKIENANTFEGVMYRSNFDKHYLDLSASWNFGEFKKIIEIKNKTNEIDN